MWSMQRHPQYRKKEDLLEAVKTDPDIRQDHSAGVERYRVAKKRAKAAGRRRVTDDQEYMRPPTVVQKQGKAFFQLCEPDIDFMPDYVYAKEVGKGKQPQDLGKPTVAVRRLDGTVLRGVTFAAEGGQPPPGCFRIKQGDEFATLKFQDLANSADEVFAGETADAMTKSMAQQDIIGAAHIKAGGKLEETYHFSAKGVYNSLASLKAELEDDGKEVETDKGKKDAPSAGSSGKPAAAVLSKREFKDCQLHSYDSWKLCKTNRNQIYKTNTRTNATCLSMLCVCCMLYVCVVSMLCVCCMYLVRLILYFEIVIILKFLCKTTCLLISQL
jgi:hypothetical protein